MIVYLSYIACLLSLSIVQTDVERVVLYQLHNLYYVLHNMYYVVMMIIVFMLYTLYLCGF